MVQGAPQVAVETEQSQLCLTGVRHGQRYQIRVRSGLPSAAGEQLRADAELNVYVPDRTPFVGFANNAYVMPAGLGGGLPITSVNAKSADIAIYRFGALKRPGLVTGLFVAGYALSRITVEFFREPDPQLGYLFGGWLTMGMLLSLPMLLVGLWAIFRARAAHPANA